MNILSLIYFVALFLHINSKAEQKIEQHKIKKSCDDIIIQNLQHQQIQYSIVDQEIEVDIHNEKQFDLKIENCKVNKTLISNQNYEQIFKNITVENVQSTTNSLIRLKGQSQIKIDYMKIENSTINFNYFLVEINTINDVFIDKLFIMNSYYFNFSSSSITINTLDASDDSYHICNLAILAQDQVYIKDIKLSQLAQLNINSSNKIIINYLSLISQYEKIFNIYSKVILIKNINLMSQLVFELSEQQNLISQYFEIENIFIFRNLDSDISGYISFDHFTENLKISNIYVDKSQAVYFSLFLIGLSNTTINNLYMNLENLQDKSFFYSYPIIYCKNLQNFTLMEAKIQSNFSVFDQNIIEFKNVINITINKLNVENTIFKQNMINVQQSNFTLLNGLRIKNCFFRESLIQLQETHQNIISNSKFIQESNQWFFSYFQPQDDLNQSDEIFQKKQMLILYDQNDGSKSLINIYNFQKFEKYDIANEVVLQNIQADFCGYDSRFISVDNANFQILIEQSSFSNMKSFQNGGCLRLNKVKNIQINSSNFINCKSDKFGGAIYILPQEENNNMQFTGLNIQGNKASFGGGIYIHLLSVVMQVDVTFKNNTSTYFDNDLFMYKPQFTVKQIIEYIPNYFQQEYLTRNIPMSKSYNLIPGSIYIIAIELQFVQDKDVKTIDDDFIFKGNMYDFLFFKSEQLQLADAAQYLNYSLNILQFNETNPYILFQPNSKLLKYKMSFYYQVQMAFNVKFSSSQCIEGQQRIQFNNVDKSRYICQYCTSMSANIKNDTFECLSCDSQVFSKCYLNYTELNIGYWRQSNQISKDQIYKCQSVFHDSCIGGSGFGNNLCSEGRIGNECTACDETSSFWNSTYTAGGLYSCVKCEDITLNSLKISIGFLLFIIILFIINFNNFKKIQNFLYQYYLSKMQIVFIGTSFTKFGLASVYIKILSFNASLLVFIQNQLEINFKNSLLQASIQYSAPLQTTFASVNCALYEFFPTNQHQGIVRLKFYLILPLIIIPLTLITPFIRYVFKKSSLRFLKYNIALSIIYTLFIVFYNLILSNILDSLTCRSFGNGERALQIDLTVPCDQASNYFIYSLVGLVIYSLFVPAYLIYNLISSKNQLYTTQTLFQYGFLYLEYKKQFYYWEFIRFGLKISFLIVQKLFFQNNQFMNCLYIIFLTLYQYSLQKFQPFQRSSFNKIELISIQIVFLTFVCTIIFQSQNSSLNQYISYLPNIFLSACLLIVLVFNLYICLATILSLAETTIQKILSSPRFSCIHKYFSKFYKNNNQERTRRNLRKLRQKVKYVIQFKNQQEEYFEENSSNQFF
ncbi:hypothetical protein ABPG73_020848 [Tetrahymena malaccensis]